MKKIIANRVRCKHCNAIIQSFHRHDFKQCKCGKVFVDGGTDYQRFGWPDGDPNDHLENLCVYEEDFNEIHKSAT